MINLPNYLYQLIPIKIIKIIKNYKFKRKKYLLQTL